MKILTIFQSGEKVDSPFQNPISTAIYCQANFHLHKWMFYGVLAAGHSEVLDQWKHFTYIIP